MTHLAMAYADLPDIDETPPLDEADRACMEEIKGVLARHDKLDRFGLTLLHQHFPVHEDEMLLETCDPQKRELLMRTVPKAEVDEASVVETSWRLSDSTGMTACDKVCTKLDGKHWQSHDHRSGIESS